MTFTAGTWIWSRELYSYLYRNENNLLRKMVRVNRRPDEGWTLYITRWTRKARQLFHRLGHQSLATRVLREIHGLAGQAFREADQNVNPKSLTLLKCAAEFRDVDWWTWKQAYGE
eukprot:10361202-Karenia_brevis.AAC.1